jgi:hypothetical protein
MLKDFRVSKLIDLDLGSMIWIWDSGLQGLGFSVLDYRFRDKGSGFLM